MSGTRHSREAETERVWTALLAWHAVAGYLVQNGRITENFGTDGSVPRRESHYIGLYHRLLVDRRPLMPREQSGLLHHVLLRGE
ncbi:hypothetical protein [Nonomuraea harbinensis]|uniref:Uncharacterized protein n=1 Tax=Nonomuraea harbinensis TaxID=1286938 RepID=A0ABW1C8K4_9ACTN|nr:hypothetical protein [Nonomuraea harbinensis]